MVDAYVNCPWDSAAGLGGAPDLPADVSVTGTRLARGDRYIGLIRGPDASVQAIIDRQDVDELSAQAFRNILANAPWASASGTFHFGEG